MDTKAPKRSFVKEIKKELCQRGYSEKAIEEILKWYE